MDGAIISLIILSALGGFLSGLLGIGGGVIFAPILMYVFEKMGYSGELFSKLVLANSFAIILLASASASYRHIKTKNIQFKYLWFIGMGGILTSLATAYYISSSGAYSKRAFLMVFLIILLLSLFKILFSSSSSQEVDPSSVKRIKFFLIGAVTGVISGFTGVGGGIIMVPAFSNVLKIPLKISIGLSSGAIFIFALANVLQYAFMETVVQESAYQIGYIRFDIILYPLLAVLICAPLGVVAAQKVSNKMLKWVFVILLLTIITKTIVSLIS
jgi:uncharacterized membrane protein YfcA